MHEIIITLDKVGNPFQFEQILKQLDEITSCIADYISSSENIDLTENIKTIFSPEESKLTVSNIPYDLKVILLLKFT